MKADNADINGVDDLAGKNVAAQSGSTGPSVLEEYAPEATIQEFSTDEEARSALEQGRVDAYVIDQTMLMSDMVKRRVRTSSPVRPLARSIPTASAFRSILMASPSSTIS